MTKFCRALALCVAFVAVLGCSESAEKKERRIQAQMTANGENQVREILRDGKSAQFRNQFVSKQGAPCGEVNAKNVFGGYDGFKRYIAAGKGNTMIDGENVNPAVFEKLWQQFCQR